MIKRLFPVFISLFFLNCLSAQEILTVGQIFGFNVNDEFQFKGNGWGQPPNADRFKIVGKYYSPDNDTVFYVRYHNSYASCVVNDSLIYSYWTETDTVFYTSLDSLVTETNYWRPYDSIDTIIEYSEQYCDSLVNGFCYAVNPFEPVYLSTIYGKGLGMVKDYYYNPTACEMFDNILFYYKRNGVGCGTPDTLYTSVADDSPAVSPVIYPNPAGDFIMAEHLPQTPVTLEIYTALGRKVMSQTLQGSSQAKISCGQLSPGIYVVIFKEGSARTIRKLIKQ